MQDCAAPVILAKPEGVPCLDGAKFYEKRQNGEPMTIVLPVEGSNMSQKCFDMALRFVRPGDELTVMHVKNTDMHVSHAEVGENSLMGSNAIERYYKFECSKAASRLDRTQFSFVAVPLKQGSITKTILDFSESVV